MHYHQVAWQAALWLGAALLAGPLAAAEPRRLTVWDLPLGAPATALPPPDAFKGFACGSDGGPPLQQLAGWSTYAACGRDASGLREVYFEYDDEQEYIARAHGRVEELPRLAGTAELAFPVVVSALFDDAGILRAIRMVSDPRPDYRPDQGDGELRSRREAYKLGSFLAARFAIDPRRDCVAQPAADGESPVGQVFVKQRCEKRAAGRRITLETRYLRKAGQHDRDPTLDTRLTRGQFDSATRLEIVLETMP
ncbi:MAG: hypothetical protein HY060_05145 [Proteobacteria bacterium]|nr:hypothetical protein [Pseudomonadota bacterium]